MINFLLGPPGGGKSYEAVAYHVLPALQAGRKVITNLPLNVEAFGTIDPSFPALIERRTETLAKPFETDWDQAESNFKRFGLTPRVRHFNKAAFSNKEDYGDPWRHPETGSGPLYVIDECHIPLPRTGTPQDVEIWYSLHRHESADVLLITQSYGKVNRAIVDLVQVCYRVKKAVALGSSKKYIRKVQDGVRGAVVNESIREYQPKFYPLYRSHTLGGGKELEAKDIKPFWKHWSVIGAGIFLVVGLCVLGYSLSKGVGLDPAETAARAKKAGAPIQTATSAPGQGVKVVKLDGPKDYDPKPKETAQKSEGVEAIGGPYDSLGLHVLGSIANGKRRMYLVLTSLNGQPMKTFSDTELVEAGYKVEPVSPLVLRLSYGGKSRWVISDGPQATIEDSAAPSGGKHRAEGARPPAGKEPPDASSDA